MAGAGLGIRDFRVVNRSRISRTVRKISGVCFQLAKQKRKLEAYATLKIRRLIKERHHLITSIIKMRSRRLEILRFGNASGCGMSLTFL